MFPGYDTKYLIGLCLLTAVLSAVLLLTVLYCCRNSRTGKRRWWWCADDACAPFEEEKSNNIAQNEENFRRFANALKENVVCPYIEPHSGAGDLSSCAAARVNVVRPITRVSSAEMMEMMNESAADCCAKGASKLSPKALLSKTQNSTFQKNSAAAASGSSTSHASGGESSPSPSSSSGASTEPGLKNVKPLNVSVVPTVMQRNINAAPRMQLKFPTVLV